MFSGLSIRTTIYDIFGYFMPGAFLLAIGYLGYSFYTGKFVIPIPIGAMEILGIIISSYALGHAVNAASKLLFEKWLLQKEFAEAVNWQRREKNEARLKKLEAQSWQIFGMHLSDLTNVELRIRCEERLPQSFATGFTFLSFYGMCRSLLFLCVLATPLGICHAWHFFKFIEYSLCRGALAAVGGVPLIALAYLFGYQYLRFAQNYFDYLKSSLLIDVEETR